ncbi:hypothetical protein [Actinotalea sp. Marseille-Q4924]|uniref:hypothetical protein n=1 Tax=Actinotalea sp. Marseille-Q4924 TaxID=2866571 RepID=UPI001CE45F88|nr:hypothetical protein [Actinotalea sp. Marseille-Q4924]
MSSSTRDRPPAPAAPPPSLRVVVVVAVVEAVAIVVLSGWGVVQLVTGQQTAVGVVLFLVLFGLAVAATLVGSARALWEGRRTGRAPVATWQLLQGATALAVLQATSAPAAWAVLVLSVVVFVLLLTRPVVAYTVDR